MIFHCLDICGKKKGFQYVLMQFSSQFCETGFHEIVISLHVQW